MNVAAAFTVPITDSMEPKEHATTDAFAGESAREDLAQLFRDNHKTVFRAAYRVTGSPSDAEDVLQTVFMRLISRDEKRDLSPNPEGYLYRSAVNAALDVVRRRNRGNSISLDAMDISQIPMRSGSSSPEQDVVEMELHELFRRAVAKLEGRGATAFVLRYYEGYDNARIAEILGTSPMVVAVTLHRARTRLRKEIGNYLEKHHEAQ
ncbi:MAG: sigma-70 family RNA polymerase sigma factor [Pyrinomonadaceae bacterium]